MEVVRFRVHGGAAAVAALLALCLLVAVAGCGAGADPADEGAAGSGGGSGVVLEENGSIDAADTRDADHAGLPYDAYAFDAESGDTVSVEVAAQGFTPLLKLTEVATGAVLAEWEAEYSEQDALTYIIAGPGSYEARVYALDDGRGDYTLTVRIDR